MNELIGIVGPICKQGNTAILTYRLRGNDPSPFGLLSFWGPGSMSSRVVHQSID